MAGTRNVRLHLTRWFSAALLTLLCAAAACSRNEGPIILATTSSVGNSGLLNAVLPEYASGTVRPVLVGSGRALDMLAGDSADVVISHAPARETAALASHPEWSYRKILYNDFIIAGPAEDPARVRDANGAVEAITRIAQEHIESDVAGLQSKLAAVEAEADSAQAGLVETLVTALEKARPEVAGSVPATSTVPVEDVIKAALKTKCKKPT